MTEEESMAGHDYEDDGYCTECGCNVTECNGPTKSDGLDPNHECQHIDADGELTC